jgi:hypothetical protein
LRKADTRPQAHDSPAKNSSWGLTAFAAPRWKGLSGIQYNTRGGALLRAEINHKTPDMGRISGGSLSNCVFQGQTPC